LTDRKLAIRLGMRSTVACMAILVLAAGVFSWQRSQNAGLRAQIAEQREALQANQVRVEDLSQQLMAEDGNGRAGTARPFSPSDVRMRRLRNDTAVARADERRVIVDQYAGVIAQMNLPAATAARLQDLLTDRIETVLDTQDSAVEVGFAEGSLETERAVARAVDEVNRNIAMLVGSDGIRRLDGLPASALPEPSLVPQQPAAPIVNVTVVVQAPAEAASVDTNPAPALFDAGSPVSPYLYIPVASFVTFPRPFHAFVGARAATRPHHFANRLADR
jgi:hypothetical protein